jgi:RNA polymerase sigma-70 factor (ECF subfamily)
MTARNERAESLSHNERVMAEIVRCQARLRGLIQCLVFETVDVEDILQDTNMVILRKVAEFDPETDFWAWASSVARFEVMSYVKKKARTRLVFNPELMELLADDALTASHDADDPRRQILRTCINKLPSSQQQLLQMRYSDEANVQTVAEAVARPVGSVRQALYRIRLALLACIERSLEQGQPT